MTPKYKQIATWILWGLAAIVSLYLIVVLGYEFASQLTAYPGATLNGTEVSRQSKTEIEKIALEKDAAYQKTKITLESSKPTSVEVSSLGLTIDPAKTADAVIKWGADNPFVLGQKKDFPLVYNVDSAKLEKVLLPLAGQLESVATDPTLSLSGAVIQSSSGDVGNRVNLVETVARLIKTAGNHGGAVKIAEFSIEPSFTNGEVNSQAAEIKQATANPVTLTASGHEFVLNSADLISLVSLSEARPVYARIFGDDILFAPLNGSGASGSLFSEQRVSDYLTNLTGQINQSPQNAQLAAADGVVVVTKPSVTGQTLNVATSTETVLRALNSGQSQVALAVDLSKPEVREDNLAELGLKELVSTGFTNFAGSPVNRIHNVRTGAAKFNGVLIKPGQDFSFIKTLGPVDASTGYLPELVILENKTTKEFGGGMCQVSSTAFRAALNAGMPILERRYHSYPVSYYKPYGVDATVYIPKPDLVFTNDTGHYILIQTHIEGYKLTFDFYGTKLSRTVSFAGTESGAGAVPIVEKITPLIYDAGARGRASFTAQFWRFIYDESGNLIKKSTWVSKYDSPDKYPH